MTNHISKVLDRVRKMLALAEHSGNENEAALAASRAAKLMEEYQLSEALVRLDDPQAKPEAILRDARLEPDAPKTGRKRVAWKETISNAVAEDLGVRTFFRYFSYWTGNSNRESADVRGFGRESAIQTWQYTSQYLWRQIDELADKAWADDGDDGYSMGETRAWKNAFRSGCASRISERIYANRKAAQKAKTAEHEAVVKAQAAEIAAHVNGTPTDITEHVAIVRESLALAVVEKDDAEVAAEYEKIKWSRGSASSVGSTSSTDGYGAGRAAGDRVALGGKRAGLSAGQGRLK